MSLGDTTFAKVFRHYGPFDIVANFAAHKHVRSEKDRFSIEAMIENNVLRAKRLLDLLNENPPKHFFCVSTDKATNPVNIMGASKSLMEKVIMGYSGIFPVTTARFANVAFSNGSLLDGFIYRINKHQPLSAPLDVKRYFVSPLESGQICMLACMLGRSAEIFFPKLNYSRDLMTFAEIAERFLATMGLNAERCGDEQEAREKAAARSASSRSYPVYFFHSDTTGEKPVEEFFSESEAVDWDRFSALGVIQAQSIGTVSDATEIANELSALFAMQDIAKGAIVTRLKKFLPDFDHEEKGKNLDQKM
jgi:FlaA1/EpsC-like NDP-sugar epimerase